MKAGVENVSNFYDRLKSGAKAAIDSFGPGRYSAGGVNVVCPHCKHYEFQESVAQLNTAGMTFFKLDWLNKSATTLTCTNCGLIQWYDKSPERL